MGTALAPASVATLSVSLQRTTPRRRVASRKAAPQSLRKASIRRT